MIKIIGIAFITLLFSLFLKDKVPQISIIISVSGVIFIALVIAQVPFKDLLKKKQIA